MQCKSPDKKVGHSQTVVPDLMIWKQFHYHTIKMLYNRCTGIYKFGNNTYPRRMRRRSNLGHIFRGGKSASYGPGNTEDSGGSEKVIRVTK